MKATSNNKDEELKNLQQSLPSLENENEMLKEEVESMHQKDYIETFENVKYKKEVRMLYYDFLLMN